MKTHPHIESRNGKKTLIVNGKPFIMLAGEVHNSNSSSLAYMEQIWAQAKTLGMNCLLLPVTWELTEPEEGVFDFFLVQGLIEQARRFEMKIGFLWFGAWKNAQCYYAPEWVKRDLNRFRRAQVIKGRNFYRNKKFYDMPYTTLSYLCPETRAADARAFAKLMAFIREIDGEENTVITVQVENETGLMGAVRENSDEADALFAEPVPQDFADHMRSHTDTMVENVRQAVEQGAPSGSWAEVFGDAAEEIFSAYHVASYVNAVAEAGKKAYPLPLSANCWLNKAGEGPGTYPSGGPVSRMMEVWHHCAPNIDIIAPDIYVPNFVEVCDEYTRRNNPLYIPECATHSYAGPRAILCVGHYHAMCYSPFGFEDMGKPFTNNQMYLFGADVTDPALKTPQNVEEYGKINRFLQSMMPLLTEKYGTDDLQAASSEAGAVASFRMGSYQINAIFDSPLMGRKDGACLVLKENEDTFYLLVHAAALQFLSADPMHPSLDILVLEEGQFVDGQWVRGRRLNGDEAVLTSFDAPTLLKAKLFAYD